MPEGLGAGGERQAHALPLDSLASAQSRGGPQAPFREGVVQGPLVLPLPSVHL